MAKRVDTSGLNTDFVISQAKPENRGQGRAVASYDPSASEPTQETGVSPEITPMPITPLAVESEPEQMKEKEVPREEPKRRRGKAQTDPQDYLSLFLHEASITARSGKTVYICQEHHDRITKILQVIGKNEVSLFSYIYNVLEHHFSIYQDDMNDLYDTNLSRKVF
jgi:hypothetical protein